jgi:LPXTG-motif cell wall-anchored protein
MKTKLSIIFCSFLLLFVVFSGSVLAYPSGDEDFDGYYDNDFNKIQAFLNLTSTDPTMLNGEQLNASYNASDATTWTGVTWSSTTPKKIEKIEWPETYLKGSLDVSDFSSLTRLECTYGEVSSVNLSGDKELTYLDVSDNELEALDVSANTKLQTLLCEYNYLTALNVSTLTSLKVFSCEGNELETLDVSTNTALTDLYCGWNYFITLDISNNTSLSVFSCEGNELDTLDISANTALTELYCAYNYLTVLNVSSSTALEVLSCEGNELDTLDISANTALIELYCGENYLTALDVSDNTNLEALFCDMNELTSLDFSNCTNLVALVCPYNKLSGTLDLSAYANLEFVLYYNNKITSLVTGTAPYYLLSGYPNPLTLITSNIFTPNQNFTVNGDGYIEFETAGFVNIALLYAEGHSKSVFVNWTMNGEVLSTSPIHYIDINDPETDDIIANFAPGLTSSPSDNVVYEGGKLILQPLFEGGEWSYDKAFFKADFSDPGNVVFTALKSGKTTIRYTQPDYEYEDAPEIELESLKSKSLGISATTSDKIESYIKNETTALDEEDELFDPIVLSVDVTIKDTLLPQTGQSFTTPIALGLIGLAGIGALVLFGAKKRKNA